MLSSPRVVGGKPSPSNPFVVRFDDPGVSTSTLYLAPHTHTCPRERASHGLDISFPGMSAVNPPKAQKDPEHQIPPNVRLGIL